MENKVLELIWTHFWFFSALAFHTIVVEFSLAFPIDYYTHSCRNISLEGLKSVAQLHNRLQDSRY